jgi:threonine dehydratase
VVLAGEDFDAAKLAARAIAEREGWHYVEDGREQAIAEGAGTIAVELCAWPEQFDVLLVPVGNGALINGIGRWMKARSPATRIVGVCAAGAPAMERSWRSSTLVTTPAIATIADGIGVRVPVPEALEAMRQTVDDMVLVSEDELRQAMRLLLDDAGLLAEPAGAAGIAAALHLRDDLRGQFVAVPICGSNVAPGLLAELYGPTLPASTEA